MRTRSLLWGCGFIGCAYLVLVSLDPESGFFCEVLETDCSSVVHSSYGVLGGWSTASLGLGYFLFQLVFSSGRSSLLPPANHAHDLVSLSLSLLALSASTYYALVMAVVLKTSCAACYGVHAINVAVAATYLQNTRRRSSAAWRPTRTFLRESWFSGLLLCSALLAVNLTLAVNLMESKYSLAAERRKLADNLQYHQYLFQSSPLHKFQAEAGEIVIGEKALGIHQIVLFYKDGCHHCQTAKHKLSEMVGRHETSVHLILKNAAHLSPTRLEELGIPRTPAVFIDGKRAIGWEVPGFMDAFLFDCGC